MKITSKPQLPATFAESLACFRRWRSPTSRNCRWHSWRFQPSSVLSLHLSLSLSCSLSFGEASMADWPPWQWVPPWPTATPVEFDPVPRICHIILSVYKSDLRNPQWEPSGWYKLNPDWVIKRVTYKQTQGHALPYLIYCDQEHHHTWSIEWWVLGFLSF